LGYWVIELLSY